jgi:hypothetical protein
MIFPPFLFLITRMGNYPCIFLLLALGEQVASLKLQLKMGQPPWWRLPHFLATQLSGA